ncbi:MAG: molybdopterin molybdenumtransferase MoeA [Gallionella sp.]|jgi:molybdopterin molybdotransferase|nr:molybdopterin molybdenumtransferase MoeA [Gallionella sp.]
MEYLSVNNALRCVLESVKKQPEIETVRLEQALGRVLAEEVYANRDQPPYDVSAMDGYALRSADLSCIPVTLTIVEDIKAGDMPTKCIQAGQCARIMTGAPVPQGADAVLRVEDTQSAGENLVQINTPVNAGNDIRRLGENMRDGELVLRAGTEITPGVVGILATAKCARLQVTRRPRVAILSTGDELEDMDDPVDPNKIPNSNSYALMAQVQALGIEPTLLGIARDDPAELAEYLQRGLHFDVLLVSGGSSVGLHDHVRPTLENLGVNMLFWRVAMKPGHPLAFGTTARTAVFGLPGNPVSSMVCFAEFVAPALRQMMGHTHLHRRTISARLTHDVKHKPGRTEFIRVNLAQDEHGYSATSTGTQSSGVSLSMARAEGLLVVSSASNRLLAGEQVAVQLLDGTAFQNEIGFRA